MKLAYTVGISVWCLLLVLCDVVSMNADFSDLLLPQTASFACVTRAFRYSSQYSRVHVLLHQHVSLAHLLIWTIVVGVVNTSKLYYIIHMPCCGVLWTFGCANVRMCAMVCFLYIPWGINMHAYTHCWCNNHSTSSLWGVQGIQH